MKKVLLFCAPFAWLTGEPARAIEWKPETAAAFDQYIRATEAHQQDETGRGKFPFLDGLPESRRAQNL